jgi:acyl carrier protein
VTANQPRDRLQGEHQRLAATFESETERQVAEVFAKVLDLQYVLSDDDIFSLGGDSFEAVLIALELEHLFQVSFPVEILEDSKNVRTLATWIDSQRRANRQPRDMS